MNSMESAMLLTHAVDKLCTTHPPASTHGLHLRSIIECDNRCPGHVPVCEKSTLGNRFITIRNLEDANCTT